MAKSLKQLQRENKKLQEKIKAGSELVKLEQERVSLGQQNRKILRQLRRGPTEKAIRRELKAVGKGFFRGGVSVGKAVVRYGRFLDEQQQKSDRQSRKVKRKTVKKSSRKKR